MSLIIYSNKQRRKYQDHEIQLCVMCREYSEHSTSVDRKAVISADKQLCYYWVNKNLKNLYKQWGSVTCLSVQRALLFTITVLPSCFTNIIHKTWLIHHWAVFMICTIVIFSAQTLWTACEIPMWLYHVCAVILWSVKVWDDLCTNATSFLPQCQNASVANPLHKYCVVTLWLLEIAWTALWKMFVKLWRRSNCHSLFLESDTLHNFLTCRIGRWHSANQKNSLTCVFQVMAKKILSTLFCKAATGTDLFALLT